MSTPAALNLVTDADEARARYALVDATIAQLTLSAFPQPTITNAGDEDDPEWVLVCPWCKTRMSTEDGITEVDCSIRWNEGEIRVDDDHVNGDVIISQADSQFDTICYLAACCETPIDLPEGWDSTWL